MCLQEAGVDRPHRRLKAAVSAYVLNVDITGPFVAGSDVGTGKKVKYALVATVAIPAKEVTPGPGEADGEEDEELRGEREHQGEPGDTADPGDHAPEDEALEGLECDDEEPRVSDAVAEAVNVKVRDEMKDALRGYQVQNVGGGASGISQDQGRAVGSWAPVFQVSEHGHTPLPHALRQSQGIPRETGSSVVC